MSDKEFDKITDEEQKACIIIFEALTHIIHQLERKQLILKLIIIMRNMDKVDERLYECLLPFNRKDDDVIDKQSSNDVINKNIDDLGEEIKKIEKLVSDNFDDEGKPIIKNI